MHVQGIVVYPVYPKELDGVRVRLCQRGEKADQFDARVLAAFLRTDHAHLRPLRPSSEAAQELKLLTEDYQRQVRQQTRLVNQLTITLKVNGSSRPARRSSGMPGTSPCNSPKVT